MTSDQLTVERHNSRDTLLLQSELLAVYRQVYADRLSDPFYTPQRFWERIERYAERPGFQLVTGHVDTQLVGYILGETLPANTRWWEGLIGEPDPALVHETGNRTFAINDLMVLPEWRRHGFATSLCATILDSRPEQRATLLVRTDNHAAEAAYTAWGFTIVGQIKPFPDSPTFNSMIRDIRNAAES